MSDHGAERGDSPAGTTRRLSPLVGSIFLVLLVIACFGRVANFDFINYDDPDYFSNNPHVQGGLTKENVIWAFQTELLSSRYPLTWLSFMLDAELFGKGPVGPHLVNVGLHAANSVLVFLLLRGLTGSFWRSLFVAALFAVHPLRVEPVAWISERKGLLSTLFTLLAILAYARTFKKPGQFPEVGAEAAATAPLGKLACGN